MILKIAHQEGRQALVLDAALLKSLNAQDVSEFEVTRNGEVIELRPVQIDRESHIARLANEVMHGHDEAFRKLSN